MTRYIGPASGGGGGAGNLRDLGDVSLGLTIPDNAALVYRTSNSAWSAGTIVTGTTISLPGLTDVTISSPSSGQALVYNGSAWENAALSSSGLGDSSVITRTIATGAVVGTTISAGAVSNAKLADASVTSGKVGTKAIGARALNIVAGDNITFSSSADVLTITASGGSSVGSLADLSDVTISNMTAGEVLIATGTNSMGNGKVGAGGIADGAVNTGKIEGLDSTSSGFLQADGDGTVSIGTPAGAYELPEAGSTLGGAKTGGDLDFSGGVATLKDGVVDGAALSGLTNTSSGFVTIRSGALSIGVPQGGGSDLEKASVAEMRAGTDDAKYATALGTKAAIKQELSSDIPEATLTGMELVGANQIDAVNEIKLNSGNLMNLRLSAARYQEIKPLLHHGNIVQLIRSDGTVELNVAMERAQEFDESASTDDLVIELDTISPLTLSSAFTNLTLKIRAHWADEWEEAVDAFMTTNLSGGTGITVTHAGGSDHGITIAVGTITTANLSGLTATSSGFLQADGDGTISIGTPSGGGDPELSDFAAIADSTALDKANDSVLMGDGSALARMGLDRFEEEIEPLELKTITLTGYTYQNRTLPTGAGGWTISTITNTKYAIFNGKNTDESRQLTKIMTPNFKVRVQGSNASRWYEFVVSQAAATQAGSILGAISDEYIDSSAAGGAVPFSNDESCTVTSNGRHLSYGDLEHVIDTTRRTQAASAYGIGQYFADNTTADLYTEQFDRYIVTGTGAITDDGDAKVDTANREWTIRTTDSEWAEVEPVLRKDSLFSIVDRSDSSVKQAGRIVSVNRNRADVAGDRVISFKYAAGATGSLSNSTEIDDADIIFTSPHAAANRNYVLSSVKAGTGINRSTSSNGDVTLSLGATIPSKASAAEMRTGTDDAKYATALGVKAAIDYDKTSDIPEATLTGLSLVGSASISGANQVKVNTGNFMNMRLSPARYQEIKALLHRGNTVQLIDSGGTVRYTSTLDRDEEFNESASLDDLVLNMDSDGGLALDQAYSNVTLRIRASWADDWEEAVDAFLTTNLVAGDNVTITHATGTAHTITIGATGGSGGTFATQGTANLGNSTNTIISPATLHGVVEHLAHVASYVGFTHVNSGNDMSAGTWWINSNGTQLRARGHSAAETQRMLNQFLIDRSCILERSAARLDFDFTDVVAITQGSNSVVQCTITNHSATPATPTLTGTDWVIRVLPEQNKQILNHAPKGSIPPIAITPSSTSGQVLTTSGGVAIWAAAGGGGLTIGGSRSTGSIVAAGTGTDDFVWARDANASIKGLSAGGGPEIGSTLGVISGAVSSVTPTTTGLLPVPHPNQSNTPSGTGEVTFTPQSTASTFRADFSSTFGWNNGSTGNRGFHMFLLRKIGSAAETIVHRAENWLVTQATTVDFTGYLFYVDAPNTTETVRYRWAMIRRSSSNNNTSAYPNVQSAGFIECPNKD